MSFHCHLERVCVCMCAGMNMCVCACVCVRGGGWHTEMHEFKTLFCAVADYALKDWVTKTH